MLRSLSSVVQVDRGLVEIRQSSVKVLLLRGNAIAGSGILLSNFDVDNEADGWRFFKVLVLVSR